MASSYPSLQANSWLSGANAAFIEDLYEQYLVDPNAVSEEWRSRFDQWQAETPEVRDVPRAPIEAAFRAVSHSPQTIAAHAQSNELDAERQVSLLRLISCFRIQGAAAANLDPLHRHPAPCMPELDPAYYGFTDADQTRIFGTNIIGMERASLADVLVFLRQTYCETIGLEYTHITSRDERMWVRDWFESRRSTPQYSQEKKKRILKQLTAAETLEQYLHRKYVGQKRFSLEGGEALIPALDHLVQASSKMEVKEIVFGMAHRGRLNVLVNVLGKLPRDLFVEFEGKQEIKLPSGDVKYHLGFSSEVLTDDAPIHLSLAFNPSHLEIVNPVVEGSVRARQQKCGGNKQQTLPVLIHGDAAFIGLGTNQGMFNLSQTRGYSTGGTVHLVINNQIGFTTSDPRDNRSTLYCTDIAKFVEAPIFHVNGDDPEAVCLVTQAALEYRHRFNKDVVVDIVCFRKHGHNEADDPFLTQPMMYKKITEHPGARAKYLERLVREGVLSASAGEAMIIAYREALDRGDHVEQATLSNYKREGAIDVSRYFEHEGFPPVVTAVTQNELLALAEKLTIIPEGFKLRSTVEKELRERLKMAQGQLPTNWGMAETLAYATLLVEGFDVRLSGEDSGRGTFSHRHAVLHDQNRERWDQGSYLPLQNLQENQGNFLVIDSVLNEEAVLAFEYGYASAALESLVIWEAQFGDFANGAQVVIDQFISSGESKWGRLCGLVMFLPHGYDGQGPEHSSARIERYLQLCAEQNMRVVMLSESAQMFHILRTQMLQPVRKPLVVILSKRLLRAKNAMSPIADFTHGEFRLVIGDPELKAEQHIEIRRVLLCAGQVSYDLFKGRSERQVQGSEKDIAIVRVEQLYPFPEEALRAELDRYPAATEILWVQEEPRNQGAWYQIRHHLETCVRQHQKLSCAARPASASPAVGYMSKHLQQLEQLVSDAFELDF